VDTQEETAPLSDPKPRHTTTRKRLRKKTEEDDPDTSTRILEGLTDRVQTDRHLARRLERMIDVHDREPATKSKPGDTAERRQWGAWITSVSLGLDPILWASYREESYRMAMKWQAEQLRLDQPVEVIVPHQALPTGTSTPVAPTTGYQYQQPQPSNTGYQQMPETATSVAPSTGFQIPQSSTTGYPQPQPSTSGACFTSPAFNTFPQPGYNSQQQLQQLPFNSNPGNENYQLVWAPGNPRPPVDPYNIPSLSSSFLGGHIVSSATEGGTRPSSRSSGKTGTSPLRPGKSQRKTKESDSDTEEDMDQ
jgi:hypothetical protein